MVSLSRGFHRGRFFFCPVVSIAAASRSLDLFRAIYFMDRADRPQECEVDAVCGTFSFFLSSLFFLFLFGDEFVPRT